jgi:hypothetical protein
MGLSDFSRGENRITRRPLVLVLVSRGSGGWVMIFAAASYWGQVLKKPPRTSGRKTQAKSIAKIVTGYSV